MPIPSKPSLLRNVIGYDADVFSLPDTTVEGSGALSYESGWPRITGTSLKAGGKAPQREYFNQVNKMLSQHLFFLQSGNVYDWDASLNYNAGAHVLGSDGLEYVAVSPSGPDVPGVGAKDPAGSRNKSQWLLLAALLMSSDGGLVVDPVTGKGAVDFKQMPMDKFEALLKSIRVPIWLTKNKDFYVNGTTGSDTLDDGRGESEEKPFKTIQACASYVCDNYNVSRYTLTVHIAPGTYAPFSLGGYSRSTGRIVFEGPAPKFAKDFPVIIEGMDKTLVAYSGAGPFYFKNIKFRENMTPNIGRFSYIVGGGGTGQIYLDRFFIEINLSGEFTEPKYFRTIYTTAGTIYLQNSSPDDKSYVEVNGHPDTGVDLISAILCAYQMGQIQMLGAASDEVADIICSGRSTNFAYAGGGLISRNIGYTYRMRFSGTYTGRRYVAAAGGGINTERAGAEYFPGTGPGTVEADTYSWYK